ncbi:MAG: hypothetical protein QXX95_02820 [Nitrososphaerales archaeon]
MPEYKALKLSSPAFLREDSPIYEAKAIVFDCDGVLIDARDSYNMAVVKTVEYIMGKLTGIRFKAKRDIIKALYLLRSSGGFNSDWDSTYCIILKLFSELPESFLSKFNSLLQGGKKENLNLYEKLNELSKGLKKTIKGEQLKEALYSLEDFKADERGYKSVEEYLFSNSNQVKSQALKNLKEFLNYPDEVGFSLISTIFNDYFYGPELDERLKGLSRFRLKRLINYERVLVNEERLKRLKQLFNGKMSLATGRSYRGTRYTLGKLMDYFNLKVSVFLEDIIREKRLKGEEYEALVKPNPYPLLKASEVFDGKVIYVGDSMEDLLMSKRANEIENRFFFVGFYSTNLNPSKHIELLKKEGADLIVKDMKDFLEALRREE